MPGAPAGFCDTVSKFGSGNLTLAQILAPAIEYAEEGFPVHQISAQLWDGAQNSLKAASPNHGEILKNGDRAPKEGEIMRVPTLARSLRELAEKGKKGFYEGRVAKEIVKAVRDRGGVLSLEDLRRHGEIGSVEVEPISLEIPWGAQEGMGPKTVWQCKSVCRDIQQKFYANMVNNQNRRTKRAGCGQLTSSWDPRSS